MQTIRYDAFRDYGGGQLAVPFIELSGMERLRFQITDSFGLGFLPQHYFPFM
jgi:hypothetical protein